MRQLSVAALLLARVRGPALSVACCLAALGLSGAASAGQGEDHDNAVAALADLKAAVGELVQADASYATDRNVYHRASQRAINALAGERGEGYAAAAGTSADATGAIGHIDALLDRTDTPVWVQPLRGAEANMRAAVMHLLDSLKARELMDYQIAASRALTYLEVARGRASEVDVFGGLEGALADTVLGVPAGGRQVDGCAPPSAAPAFGTHGGYMAWVSVPGGDGPHSLPQATGGTEVFVRGGSIVLRTAAAALVTAACTSHAEAAPSPPGPPPAATAAAPASPLSDAKPEALAATAKALAPTPKAAPATPLKSAGEAPSYTQEQAQAGAQIFASKCVSCHGANLQGIAAPSVAGTDFLTTAEHNGWTLEVIRYLVFQMMPLNAPASLSPQQSASVMAFLLASNCYPAGDTPFPTADDAGFTKIKLGPVPGSHPPPDSHGVCKLG